jgi:hypothetical protein
MMTNVERDWFPGESKTFLGSVFDLQAFTACTGYCDGREGDVVF